MSRSRAPLAAGDSRTRLRRGSGGASRSSTTKTGSPSHAPEACLRVGVQYRSAARGVELGEPAGEDVDVGDGEVHSLGPRRGNYMGRVPGEKEPAVSHGFADKGAHLHDVLLEDAALL